MKITVHHDEASWLAGRRKKLNASEVPALLGCYPSKQSEDFKNPYHLWRVKTGQVEDQELEHLRLRFDLGHLVEDRVAREVEKRESVTLLDLGDYTTISEGILSATTDRLIVPAGLGGDWTAPVTTSEEAALSHAKMEAAIEAATGVCQIKSDGTIQEAGSWSEGGKFDYALVQIHVEMMVTGKQGGLLAALFGLGLGFEVWPVHRSPELVSLIEERAEEFWACVLSGTPPGDSFLSESEAIGRSLAAIYSKDSGEEVELDESAQLQLEHYEHVKDEIKRLEAEKTAIENQVKLRMEDATWAKIPGAEKRWQWKVEPRKGYTVEPSEPRTLRVVKA